MARWAQRGLLQLLSKQATKTEVTLAGQAVCEGMCESGRLGLSQG